MSGITNDYYARVNIGPTTNVFLIRLSLEIAFKTNPVHSTIFQWSKVLINGSGSLLRLDFALTTFRIKDANRQMN